MEKCKTKASLVISVQPALYFTTQMSFERHQGEQAHTALIQWVSCGGPWHFFSETHFPPYSMERPPGRRADSSEPLDTVHPTYQPLPISCSQARLLDINLTWCKVGQTVGPQDLALFLPQWSPSFGDLGSFPSPPPFLPPEFHSPVGWTVLVITERLKDAVSVKNQFHPPC